MTFAEKLKSIRKQAGMSQEQLAEKLGVSRQALTKWETNAGIPDIENMMAISGELVIYTSSDETYAGGGK
jgi:transcriptional regulator with XRE-family HTH domain